MVEAYRAYCAAAADCEEARELLGDPEMKEMAQEELSRSKAEMEHLTEQLRCLLLPRDCLLYTSCWPPGASAARR